MDLSQERISISEKPAVGDFVHIVRPGVVGVSRNPVRELLPVAEGQTVVIGDRAILYLSHGPVVVLIGREWE